MHTHAQNAAIFSTDLKSAGEKLHLEVLSRFGLWRDFPNNNIQAGSNSCIVIVKKTCQLILNQWNFPSATLNEIRFVCFVLSLIFFNLNIKDSERNLCKDFLTIENADSDLKVHPLHYANELLVRVRLFFQNFCNLAQHAETMRKNVRKRVMTRLVVDRSTDHDKPHFNLFFTTSSTSKKMFVFFRTGAEKGIARHVDAGNEVTTAK